MSDQSHAYQLIELRLGRPLVAYITESRRTARSWRTIADDLSDETGVRVAHETVRRWAEIAAA